MGITADDVTAFAACISAAGVGLIYVQTRVMTSTTKLDHERTRRQAAVSMLQLWDQSLSRRASMARKLGERLSFPQSKSLWMQEEFEIDVCYKEQLIAVLPDFEKECPEQNGKLIKLTARYSTLLRWELVSYLNSLETVLSSWHHNIADRTMIEEQFEYLVHPQDGNYLLKEFRKAAGGINTYPCISAFVTHLESKHTPQAGKPRIA